MLNRISRELQVKLIHWLVKPRQDKETLEQYQTRFFASKTAWALAEFNMLVGFVLFLLWAPLFAISIHFRAFVWLVDWLLDVIDNKRACYYRIRKFRQRAKRGLPIYPTDGGK